MNDEEIKISKSNHSVVIIKNGVTVKEQFAIDDEILDYITNLQQEKEDYKSRCEKANEIINKYELIVGYYDYADEDGYWETDGNNNLQEELKDILNGRSDE